MRRRSHLVDRTASLMALQLLKRAMAGLGFSDFSLQDLQRSPNGKPTGCDGAQFSISHAAGLIACAVGVGTRVGIDLEPLTATAPLRTGRYLDRSERQAAARDAREGLRIWTAKEAILKAAGDLSLNELGSISVRGALGRYRGTRWRLWQPALAPGFIAQLATDAPDPLISHQPVQLT